MKTLDKHHPAEIYEWLMPMGTVFDFLLIRQPQFFHSASLGQDSAAHAHITQDGQVATISNM